MAKTAFFKAILKVCTTKIFVKQGKSCDNLTFNMRSYYAHRRFESSLLRSCLNGVVVATPALKAEGCWLKPVPCHKILFTAFLFGAQHERGVGGVEKKPASSLVESFRKAVNRIPPFACEM